MYKLLLILKYLRKRRIAWVSLIAVMLCTAMVLVVISVMGGWLRMFRESFHAMSGDVLVRGESLTGFPHYEEMLIAIRQLPEVKAAVPVVKTFGLINVNNEIRRGVQVMGIPDDIGLVNNFKRTLHRRSAATQPFALHRDIPYELHKPLTYRGDVRQWGGMIVGPGVIGLKKTEDGQVERFDRMYRVWVQLTVLPVTGYGGFDVSEKKEAPFWIVDDSRTQVWQYDSDTVYVSLPVLQEMLLMSAGEAERQVDGRLEKVNIPARTSEIQIAVKEGYDLRTAKQKVKAAVDQVTLSHGTTAADQGLLLSGRFPYKVETWEEANAIFLSAIEKEKVLVTFLFGIISVVAVFLIFCIFYMIVVEKTRDIGIVKSVGATSGGVAGIFLGYGAAIGIVGSALGLLAGWLVVSNINELHRWLGEVLGVQIWDPKVYMFDTIPNTMNPSEVSVILFVAIVASLLGALVPAIRAARMHPVEALRWE